MGILTGKERKTLNDAMAVFERHTVRRASWMFGPAFYDHGGYSSFTTGGVTYFSSDGEQNSYVPGNTFADRVDAALEIEARVEKDAETIKQRKIDRLRAELLAMESAT